MELLKAKISNFNVPLIYEHDESTELARLKLIFKASGAVANKKAGCSALLADILDEGSAKLGSAAFNALLEQKAIELSFACGNESFEIELSALKEHFAYGFSLLCELLAEPNFSKQALELVKTRALGAIATKKSDFDYQAKILLRSKIFEGTSFENPKIGTTQSINELSLGELKDFFKEHLSLNNLFMVLGGNVKVADVAFEKLPLKKQKDLEFQKIELKYIKKPVFTKVKSEQAYIYFASPYEMRKDERFKANVATFILGSSGFGSRLMEEIRVKRGLAYSAYARNSFGLYKSGIFGYLQTKNENQNNAMELVSSIFENFAKKGVSQKELDSARNFLLGSEALNKETLFKRLAIAQNEHYMGYDLGEFDKNLERIKSLSLDELNAFISAHSEICKLSFAVVHG